MIQRSLFVQRAGGLVLVIIIVCLDITSKEWAINHLQGEPAMVITPFLRLVYVENTGTAFGLFADAPSITRWLILFLTTVVSLVLVIMLWRVRSRWEGLAIALLLGGAVGNLWDRGRQGYVIDFIDVHWQSLHWPAFNVADSAITVGTLLFIYDLFKNR